MSGVKQVTRLMGDVDPDDFLFCRLGKHWDLADSFASRGPNRAESGRSYSYRAYCKECHRTRNGGGTNPRVTLNSHGHSTRRRVEPVDPEVAHALGVLRDARAQRVGKQGYVYCIGERDTAFGVKIGYSTNPEARVAELQTGNPRTLVLLGKVKGTEEDERRLHERYAATNIYAEWFRPTVRLLSEFNLRTTLRDHKEVIQPA